jgi:hypothetical protein
VREAASDNIWLTALNQLQPTYVRVRKAAELVLTASARLAGRNVAEYSM